MSGRSLTEKPQRLAETRYEQAENAIEEEDMKSKSKSKMKMRKRAAPKRRNTRMGSKKNGDQPALAPWHPASS